MRQRRLLMTVDAVGGVWTYAIELARALAPRGVHTTLALLGPPPSVRQREQAAALPAATLVETGLALDWLAADAAEVTATGRAVAALAAEVGADIVQLNQPGLAAEARFPAPVVAVAHSCVATWWRAVRGGEMPAGLRWQAELTRAGLLAADLMVAPSAAFARAIAETYDLQIAPHVVHNGRTPLSGAGPAAAHDFAFTAGRLWDEGKDLATLDRAAARLAVPVKAAGPVEGPHGERVRLECVHATGGVDEQRLATCLAARPVFVSTAVYEPFGLAVLEAALAGCPLVLADIPTFRELWGDVATFVPPRDDKGFADAIEALILDFPERLARGDRARAHAARYTPQAMAAGMTGLFDTLAPAARSAA